MNHAVRTVLYELADALRRTMEYNSNVETAPVCILWPDKEWLWEPIAPVLRETLPGFMTLGPYVPAERTGPAIWLRCVLAGTLPEVAIPKNTIPILYLPGVARADLRAVETCPQALQPLAELQYRGAFFSQFNGKDWTLLAFLKSQEGGLGLDVAADHETLQAMARALIKLADTRVDDLRGRRLEAADFDALLNPEPVRDLLRWLNDPMRQRQAFPDAQWEAFRAICRKDFAFDPQSDGDLTAAERLGQREGRWAEVWNRFAEAPGHYAGIPGQLRRARPSVLGFETAESWPQDNEQAEANLKAALRALKGTRADRAGDEIAKLEKEHGARREWVWARMGQAPLALALGHLAEMVRIAGKPGGGPSPEAMAGAYVESGWRVDELAWKAMAEVGASDDSEAVLMALQAVYRPWLERMALEFQERAAASPWRRSERIGAAGDPVKNGECILFADGLRYDVGRCLADALGANGMKAEIGWRWAALPTVTATAKPAVSPVAELITARTANADFRPSAQMDGKPLTHDRFKALLDEIGFQVLDSRDTGDPSGLAWTECARIDACGHEEGWGLARRLDEQVRVLTERIEGLLKAGWKAVRVVTDHGWLLVPGGMPKTDLPAFLAETRWGRCALLKSTTAPAIQMVAWHWCDEAHLAIAPGISAFIRGSDYGHGGVSLQECVIPVLRVSRETEGPTVAIREVKWIGLRCRIGVEGGAGMRADLRTRPADPKSSLAGGGKALDPNGAASLVVEDDQQAGCAVLVVIVDSGGNVLAKAPTTVGG